MSTSKSDVRDGVLVRIDQHLANIIQARAISSRRSFRAEVNHILDALPLDEGRESFSGPEDMESAA